MWSGEWCAHRLMPTTHRQVPWACELGWTLALQLRLAPSPTCNCRQVHSMQYPSNSILAMRCLTFCTTVQRSTSESLLATRLATSESMSCRSSCNLADECQHTWSKARERTLSYCSSCCPWKLISAEALHTGVQLGTQLLVLFCKLRVAGVWEAPCLANNSPSSLCCSSLARIALPRAVAAP